MRSQTVLFAAVFGLAITVFPAEPAGAQTSVSQQAPTAIALFLGGDIPISPSFEFEEAFGVGWQAGGQVRRGIGHGLHAVFEGAFSRHSNQALFFAVPLLFDLIDPSGGDMSTVRVSAGVALGDFDRAGVDVHVKGMVGLYARWFEELRYTLVAVTGDRIPSSFDAPSSTSLGLNLGLGLETPVAGSSAFFAGVELDVAGAGDALAAKTLIDLTAKAGISFRF